MYMYMTRLTTLLVLLPALASSQTDAFEAAIASRERLQAFISSNAGSTAAPSLLPAESPTSTALAADVLLPALSPFAQGERYVVPGSLTARWEQPYPGQEKIEPGVDMMEVITSVLRAPPSMARSIVARYEGVERSMLPSWAWALLAVRADGSDEPPPVERTLHLYASGPNGSALPPHTDPHDVVVLGAYGEKRWTVCTPGGAAAQTEMPWRLRTKLVHRCADVTDADIRESLSCQEYLVRAGDLLFIPALHLHSARADDKGAAHLTLGTVTSAGRGDAGLPWSERAERFALCTAVRPNYFFEAMARQEAEFQIVRGIAMTFLVLFWARSSGPTEEAKPKPKEAARPKAD